MKNKSKLIQELKDATTMERINFIASIITVSGVSLFTIISGLDTMDLSIIGVNFIAMAFLLTIVFVLIWIYIIVIIKMKKDYSSIGFLISTFLLSLFGVGFLLLITSTLLDAILRMNAFYKLL